MVFAKELRRLRDRGWTRHLVRERVTLDGEEYDAGRPLTIFGACHRRRRLCAAAHPLAPQEPPLFPPARWAWLCAVLLLIVLRTLIGVRAQARVTGCQPNSESRRRRLAS